VKPGNRGLPRTRRSSLPKHKQSKIEARGPIAALGRAGKKVKSRAINVEGWGGEEGKSNRQNTPENGGGLVQREGRIKRKENLQKKGGGSTKKKKSSGRFVCGIKKACRGSGGKKDNGPLFPGHNTQKRERLDTSREKKKHEKGKDGRGKKGGRGGRRWKRWKRPESKRVWRED